MYTHLNVSCFLRKEGATLGATGATKGPQLQGIVGYYKGNQKGVVRNKKSLKKA